MTKQELINTIAERAEINKIDVEHATNTAFDVAKETIAMVIQFSFVVLELFPQSDDKRKLHGISRPELRLWFPKQLFHISSLARLSRGK